MGLVFIPLCVQLRYISERMLLAAHYLLVCKDQHSCCKMSDTYAVNTSVAVNKQPFSGLPADIRSILLQSTDYSEDEDEKSVYSDKNVYK